MSETTTRSSSIDIGKQQVAAVYAKALLDSAHKEGSLDEVVAQLSELTSSVMDQQPRFREVLESPRVSVEEKIGLIDRTFAAFVHPTLLRFLKVLSEHERLDCLHEIHGETRRLHNEMRKVVQVSLTTATPVEESAKESIAGSLRQRFGDRIDLELHVDPSIIGGVVVRIGDKVFDGSVRQKLQTLREEAVTRAVETMRSATDQFATSG